MFVVHSLEEGVEGGVRAFHQVIETVVPTLNYVRGSAYDREDSFILLNYVRGSAYGREDSFILIPLGWSVTSMCTAGGTQQVQKRE